VESLELQQPRRRPSFATILLLVAGLYFARELLIPFALAFLMSPMLAPPIALLQRWKLGKVASVMFVVTLTCAVLGVIVWLVTQQVADLVTMLPEYKAQIIEKFQWFRGGMIEKASDAVKQLEAGLETSAQAEHAPTTRPQDVRVVAATPGGFETLLGLGFIFGPVGTLGIVLVIVTFLLLQRGDLRDRIVQLIGPGNVNLTTQAMGEITTRVGKYLRMQAVLNCVHGTAMGVGLFLLGVPNALIWGILAALLRFVPYVGPMAAMVMPIALSLAVFDGWERPLMVAGFLLTIELLSNNVLEPWLYGSSAGVSSLAVIVSAVFWAWVWGPVGLVLATPLTVVLVVIGKHVPQLHFLHVLLGEESGVDPGVRVYQRLLAMNQSDLSDITERALAEQKSFVQVCDTILIPALGMAEFDRHHGALQDFREQFIERAMREIIEDLGEQSRAIHAKLLASPTPGEPARETSSPAAASLRVLCIPAKNELDQIVALMLCQALGNVGIACQVASVDALASEKAERVDEHRSDIVCISALPPSGLVQARYLCKRLRVRFPDLEIVVGLWGSDLAPAAGLESLRIPGPCVFATTLAEARDQIQKLVTPALLRHQATAREAG
jgi:predicted PurR-regulated permease PerM